MITGLILSYGVLVQVVGGLPTKAAFYKCSNVGRIADYEETFGKDDEIPPSYKISLNGCVIPVHIWVAKEKIQIVAAQGE